MSTKDEQAARFNRLPKWAQDEITRLRTQRGYWQNELAKGITGNGEHTSDSLYVDDPRDDGGAYMPSRFRSGRFILGGRWNDYIEFRLDAPDKADDVRRVYVHSGTSRLLVEPRASNALHLTLGAP